jgi:hypothetical protein
MTLPSSNAPPDIPDRQQPRIGPSKRAHNGDCSRARRFADEIRRRYYAFYRQKRFARRMQGGAVPL